MIMRESCLNGKKTGAYAELIGIDPALRLRSPFDFAQGEESLHAERRRGTLLSSFSWLIQTDVVNIHLA